MNKKSNAQQWSPPAASFNMKNSIYIGGSKNLAKSYGSVPSFGGVEFSWLINVDKKKQRPKIITTDNIQYVKQPTIIPTDNIQYVKLYSYWWI